MVKPLARACNGEEEYMRGFLVDTGEMRESSASKKRFYHEYKSGARQQCEKVGDGTHLGVFAPNALDNILLNLLHLCITGNGGWRLGSLLSASYLPGHLRQPSVGMSTDAINLPLRRLRTPSLLPFHQHRGA